MLVYQRVWPIFPMAYWYCYLSWLMAMFLVKGVSVGQCRGIFRCQVWTVCFCFSTATLKLLPTYIYIYIRIIITIYIYIYICIWWIYIYIYIYIHIAVQYYDPQIEVTYYDLPLFPLDLLSNFKVLPWTRNQTGLARKPRLGQTRYAACDSGMISSLTLWPAEWKW